MISENCSSRWETYYSKEQAAKAKKQIDAYLEALRPAHFKCVVKPYFCFDNHAKILATDSRAYFGSQNFTESSYSNFECGVIVDQTAEIRAFVQKIVDELITLSVEYPGNDKSRFAVLLAEYETIAHRLKEHIDEWYKEVPVYKDETEDVVSFEYVRDSPLSKDTALMLAYGIEETAMEMTDYPAARAIDLDAACTLARLCEDDELLAAYRFGLSDYANESYSRNPPAPDDEELAMKKFDEEAYDRQGELEDAVCRIVPQMKEACNRLIQSLARARKVLDESPIHDCGLDNT